MTPPLRSRAFTLIGHLFVWVFFVLIVDGTLTIASGKYSLPFKPAYIVATTTIGLLISALLTSDPRRLLNAKPFFLPLLAITVLGAAMYRGENLNETFGGMVLNPWFIPSNLSYVIWPIFNTICCASLFLLARQDSWRRTIAMAAFTALVLQVACMEADMWWAAAFGDPNGRAGGLIQNANAAAMLVTILAALTFANQRLSLYAVPLAIVGVLLSQSKTGVLAAIVLAGCLTLLIRRRAIPQSVLVFSVLLVVVLAATVVWSPVLNPSPELIAAREQTIAKRALEQKVPVNPLDVPSTLEERIEARTSIDGAASMRREALNFYLNIVKENPRVLAIGMGTGFTNKFVTGPHNAFLKLAVDNGLVSTLLLIVLFGSTAWKATAAQSPQLLALTAIVGLTALTTHTLMLDPFALPPLAIGLANLQPTTDLQ
ncbi:O-antigen ligase [Bradyrhizobium sp. S3.3.6]|uniref:O-antigen ligase family protein n=1 Tax=Bradyrhizobium sp. S3.3.6 TaxID=3156429 RepID=UPI003390946B